MEPTADTARAGVASVRVGIGLIERNGHFLIRRRPFLPGSPMPGYWEFPGGKCLSDESPEACTQRECLEEVGLSVQVRRLRRVIEHAYPHGFVELHFHDCHLTSDHAEPDEATGFRWVAVHDLPRHRFPGANAWIIADLLKEHRDRDARR